MFGMWYTRDAFIKMLLPLRSLKEMSCGKNIRFHSEKLVLMNIRLFTAGRRFLQAFCDSEQQNGPEHEELNGWGCPTPQQIIVGPSHEDTCQCIRGLVLAHQGSPWPASAVLELVTTDPRSIRSEKKLFS